MTTLSDKQVIFVLYSVGTIELYNIQGKGHYGKEDFMTSFLQDITSLLGQISVQMCIEYGLDYDANNTIVLRNHPSIEDIMNKVSQVGMWIPYAYRNSAENALTYFLNYGKLYRRFKQIRNDSNYWGLNPNETAADRDIKFGLNLVNIPLFEGNDFYLQNFLAIQLRDLYTDFDMFDKFQWILDPVIKLLDNRLQMIAYIEQIREPSGSFSISLQTFPNAIRIEHTWNNNKRTYTNKKVKKMAHGGKLWFGNTELSHIGLYQMAFKLNPDYLGFTTGMGSHLPEVYKEIGKDLYKYFLNQIRISENRGNPKIRFSAIFNIFNEDLNQMEDIIQNMSKLSI